MYVGITRAKEKVYLLFTSERNIFGSTQMNPPSRFLDDIPEHLISCHSERSRQNGGEVEEFRRSKFSGISSRSFGSVPPKRNCTQDDIKLKDGDRINHAQFGEGLVISVKDDIATIAFKKTGLKKISLEFAKLEKIK